jgi:hypothetical protein
MLLLTSRWLSLNSSIKNWAPSMWFTPTRGKDAGKAFNFATQKNCFHQVLACVYGEKISKKPLLAIKKIDDLSLFLL